MEVCELRVEDLNRMAESMKYLDLCLTEIRSLRCVDEWSREFGSILRKVTERCKVRKP